MLKRLLCIWLTLHIACIYTGAQPAWTIYLGQDMEARYYKTSCRHESGNGIYYTLFSGYDHFIHRPQSNGVSETVNRPGMVLEAKSTKQHTTTGEIIFGHHNDSVKIVYQYRADVVRHGRSAALSVLNLFSKREDKIKQEEPYNEITRKVMEGSIVHHGTPYSFYCAAGVKNKNTSQWLLTGADTLRLVPAEMFRKTRNGKIIKRRQGYEGIQLMRGDTCVAAIDYNEDPMAFYLLKEINENEKIVITAFFLVISFGIVTGE